MEDRHFGKIKIIPKKVIASCGSFNHKFVGGPINISKIFIKCFMFLTKSMLSIHLSHHIIGQQTNELSKSSLNFVYCKFSHDVSILTNN
jgi:hypothetical protein